MTTAEITNYIDTAISANFSGYKSQSGEMETSDGGDGRFVGKVSATMYSGLPVGGNIFISIGTTAEGAQIVKIGRSECLKPEPSDLDLLLKKELEIEPDESSQ